MLMALDYYCATPKFTKDNIAESALKTVKSFPGNITVKGSQNRKWLEKYCHGKCYPRNFTSHFNTAFHRSKQTKKMNIVVVLKQGYSSNN